MGENTVTTALHNPTPGPAPAQTCAGIWSQTLDDLRLQMPKATFDTWLKGTTAQLQGDALTVVVANPFAQDWLERRLRPKIESSIASIAGQPLEIAFTVRGNGHLETNTPMTELWPAEDSITHEVEHYGIWAPADPTVLRILPGLAEEIGLNESIVLLQIDYWIRHSDNVRDGRRWTYQSSRDMQQKAFKWWGKRTIQRTVRSLEAQKLIFVTDKYNKHKYDRTPWFALNPEGFEQLASVELKHVAPVAHVASEAWQSAAWLSEAWQPVTSEMRHYEIWAPAEPTVLRIMPDLAEGIGLNESVVLLQLDYWIRHSDNVRAGRRWTYQSVREMQRKAFRWWSLGTIHNTIASLIRQHLILATDAYNPHEYERTRWFALNPKGFRVLESVELKQVQGGVQM